MKTTFNDINRDDCEERQYTTSNWVSRMGRSSIDIRCPWCSAVFRAYVWSLSGGGKRCRCGALFGSAGRCWKLEENEKNSG